MTPVRTAARTLMAGIFVAGGAKALMNPDPRVKVSEPVLSRVAPLLAKVHDKVPTDPRTLVQLNGAVQVIGGLLLPTRLHRVAALALIGSIIPTTLGGHRFWEHDDPATREQQQTHFLKNVGLLGGLILAALDTEGRPGLAWRTRHAAHHVDRAARRSTKQTMDKVRLATAAGYVARRLPG
jgi:putative oxidoreductase